MQTHEIAWLTAGISVFIATCISIVLIYKHLSHYEEPQLQRNIVRILILIPVYSIDSLFSLIFYEHAVYFDLVRDCYEAYVLYCFFALLMNFLEGEENLVSILERKSPVSHPPPFSCIYFQPGSRFLKKCRRCILQFVIIKPLLVLAAVIFDSFGSYNEGEFDASYAYPYILVIDNCSITVSMYYLVLFYICTHEELATFQPTLKFVCIKAVIFFSFWQGVLIAIFAYCGFFKDSGDWTSDQIATGLQDYIICIEMTPVACAFAYAFGYPHYKDGENPMNMIDTLRNDVKNANVSKFQTKMRPVIRNFTDVADVTDVLDDTIESFKVVPRKIATLKEFWECSEEVRRSRIIYEGWLLSKGLVLKKWKRRYCILISNPPGLIYFDESPYSSSTSFSTQSQDIEQQEQTDQILPQDQAAEEEERKEGLFGITLPGLLSGLSSGKQSGDQWNVRSLRGFVDMVHVVEIVEEEGPSLKVSILKIVSTIRTWWFQCDTSSASEWIRLLRELHQQVEQIRVAQLQEDQRDKEEKQLAQARWSTNSLATELKSVQNRDDEAEESSDLSVYDKPFDNNSSLI